MTNTTFNIARENISMIQPFIDLIKDHHKVTITDTLINRFSGKINPDTHELIYVKDRPGLQIEIHGKHFTKREITRILSFYNIGHAKNSQSSKEKGAMIINRYKN